MLPQQPDSVPILLRTRPGHGQATTRPEPDLAKVSGEPLPR